MWFYMSVVCDISCFVIDNELSLEIILLYGKYWATEQFNVFSSKTVLVYKPGVLVIVSLTSLIPLPTSKKTNYHFYEHTVFYIEC